MPWMYVLQGWMIWPFDLLLQRNYYRGIGLTIRLSNILIFLEILKKGALEVVAVYLIFSIMRCVSCRQLDYNRDSFSRRRGVSCCRHDRLIYRFQRMPLRG
jgi:hypothetical protein